MHALLKTHVFYTPDSFEKKDHDRNMILFLVRGELSISIVEYFDFKRYICAFNPRVRVPEEAVCSTFISQAKKECISEFVITKHKGPESISSTFNLWMSRGCGKIFDLIANRFDGNFQPLKIHLIMLQCDSTSGMCIANLLKEPLNKLGIYSKSLACVKDGDVNLERCTFPMMQVTKSKPFSLQEC